MKNKIDVKKMIYDKMKLNEVIAKKMADLLGENYDKVLESVNQRIDKKIEEAEKTFYTIGQENRIDIDKIKAEKNFFADKKEIKG